MSNHCASAKFEDESNVMEQAQVASVFVNNSKGRKQKIKLVKPTILSEKVSTSTSKHGTEFLQTVRELRNKQANKSLVKLRKAATPRTTKTFHAKDKKLMLLLDSGADVSLMKK